MLRLTYFAKGLRRKSCFHEGSFYKNCPCQSFQSSSTMTTHASEGTSSDYHDLKTTNTSLLPLIQNDTIQTASICVNNIITINFFDSNHKDCNGMSSYMSNAVKEFISTSRNSKLIRWLESFHANFDSTHRLPMPITCAWMLLKNDNVWEHRSTFLL